MLPQVCQAIWKSFLLLFLSPGRLLRVNKQLVLGNPVELLAHHPRTTSIIWTLNGSPMFFIALPLFGILHCHKNLSFHLSLNVLACNGLQSYESVQTLFVFLFNCLKQYFEVAHLLLISKCTIFRTHNLICKILSFLNWWRFIFILHFGI